MPFTRARIRCVLTIAGSDSGGGAGLEADLKTFLSHRVHGTVAVTCVTAQDTRGVRDIQRMTADLVRAQMMAVLDDLAPEAAKTGFLGGPAALDAIVSLLDRLPPLVVDPVCVDKHGAPILDGETLAMLRDILLPRAVLVTPNTDEAALLSGVRVRDRAGMLAAAEVLLAGGIRAVLVKGGRLGGAQSPDLLAQADGMRTWLDAPRVATTATHGTGDTLSASIASWLAWGFSLPDAVHLAKRYVSACLEEALEIGQGQGPIGHVPVDAELLPRAAS